MLVVVSPDLLSPARPKSFKIRKIPFLIVNLSALNFHLQIKKKGVNLLQMLLIIKYKKRI